MCCAALKSDASIVLSSTTCALESSGMFISLAMGKIMFLGMGAGDYDAIMSHLGVPRRIHTIKNCGSRHVGTSVCLGTDHPVKYD